MDREFKRLPFFAVKDDAGASTDSRTLKGVAAVFGNLDAQGDIILPGAFTKTISEEYATGRVKHLWQHDFFEPPVATITELRELNRDELPPAVLEKAPEASGGLFIARKYYDGVDKSNWILQALKAGDITEMSIGYDPVDFEIDVQTDANGNEFSIRKLKQVKLFDTSDVNWGANSATVTTGAKSADKIIADFISEFRRKAGRRNANSDEGLINQIHNAAVALGCTDCKGIVGTDDDDGKAAAARRRRLSFARFDFLKTTGV